jgi:hypothetical protein
MVCEHHAYEWGWRMRNRLVMRPVTSGKLAIRPMCVDYGLWIRSSDERLPLQRANPQVGPIGVCMRQKALHVTNTNTFISEIRSSKKPMTTSISSSSVKLSFTEKAGYSAGDAAANFVFMSMILFKPAFLLMRLASPPQQRRQYCCGQDYGMRCLIR